MTQIADIYPNAEPAQDLDPVSAFEGLAFTNRAIGAHADQLTAQFGPEAVALALESVHGQIESHEDAMRPSREQAVASSVLFAPHVQSVVYRGLALAAEDGKTNTYLGSIAGDPEHEKARRANQKLAGMVLRQFVEGNTEHNRPNGQAVPAAENRRVVRPTTTATPVHSAGVSGRHRRSEGASRPAGRSSANHTPQHARPGTFIGGHVLGRVAARRSLRRRSRS